VRASSKKGHRNAHESGPIRPVDIAYDDDDQLADPISRLDELGDLIDGTMSTTEIDYWISRLGG